MYDETTNMGSMNAEILKTEPTPKDEYVRYTAHGHPFRTLQ